MAKTSPSSRLSSSAASQSVGNDDTTGLIDTDQTESDEDKAIRLAEEQRIRLHEEEQDRLALANVLPDGCVWMTKDGENLAVNAHPQIVDAHRKAGWSVK